MTELPVSKPERVSIEEYYAREANSDAKHEFHDGEVIAMAGGTVSSSQICVNLTRRLAERLDGKPCQPLESNVRVHIQARNRDVYPDAMVVCGPVEYHAKDKSRGTILNPRVVFEVLSPSTEIYDRTRKREYYFSVPSMDTYVLLEQDRPVVDVLTRQPDGQWVITFFHGLEAVVKLTTLGIELPMRQLYDRVEFPPEPPSPDERERVQT
ncbi:MAG: Uma2 family endonuclease [Tepidisphaeraceae bacterium]